MEHKIGETFQYNDKGNIVTLQVVLDNEPTLSKCDGCFFNDSVHNKCLKEGTILGWCISREDGNPVKFIQVTMEEKRNIQISLEKAREWYNSDDSFKKELALTAYNREELKPITVDKIEESLPDSTLQIITEKAIIYRKLLSIAEYLNNIYKPSRRKGEGYIYYKILPYVTTNVVPYKDFFYTYVTIRNAYDVYFNSEEAAKKAIDILGDELNILFE